MDIDFWSVMRQEAWWQDHPEHNDFVWYWDTYHYGESDLCDEKVLDASCDMFDTIRGTCDRVHVEYDPCMSHLDYEFMCEVVQMDGTYQDCAQDFEDYDFWSAMRMDSFWTSQGQDYADFYMYWDAFHGYNEDATHGSEDCDEDLKTMQVTCQDFEFAQDDECSIFIAYSPCDDTTFTCELSEPNEYGEWVMEDCTEYFFEADFWGEMRDEQFWFLEENQQYMDFYTFWETYHAEAACAWKDLDTHCYEFEFLAEDECDIFVSYSPCETDYFVCRSTNAAGEVSDCN